MAAGCAQHLRLAIGAGSQKTAVLSVIDLTGSDLRAFNSTLGDRFIAAMAQTFGRHPFSSYCYVLCSAKLFASRLQRSFSLMNCKKIGSACKAQGIQNKGENENKLRFVPQLFMLISCLQESASRHCLSEIGDPWVDAASCQTLSQ